MSAACSRAAPAAEPVDSSTRVSTLAGTAGTIDSRVASASSRACAVLRNHQPSRALNSVGRLHSPNRARDRELRGPFRVDQPYNA